VTVFGIGRVCHNRLLGAALSRPSSRPSRPGKTQTHRLGARLHPLTIEQNAITSFRSRTTLVPCFANTIGPGLFLAADRIIGGADGGAGPRHAVAGVVAADDAAARAVDVDSFQLHAHACRGRLFYLRELAGPLGGRVPLIQRAR